MPNWCQNTFTITSEVPGAARAFYEACKGKPVYWGMQEYQLREIINPEDREEAIRKHKEEHDALPLKFTFNALVPVPQEVIDGGYSATEGVDGYHWCISHWGTKWDIYGDDDFYGPEESGLEVTDDTDEIVCSFDTAWSPPTEWMLAASTNFPDVTLRMDYIEPGGYFAGYYICCGGTELEDHSYEGEELEQQMREYGYLPDPDHWHDIYDEVTKEQAKVLFSEDKAVYGIDEDGEASKIEIAEDLDDYDIFGVSK